MLNKAKNITEGWSNYAKQKFGKLDQEKETIARARYSICEICTFKKGEICDPRKKGKGMKTGKEKKGCGCYLPAKVASMKDSCPLEKW